MVKKISLLLAAVMLLGCFSFGTVFADETAAAAYTKLYQPNLTALTEADYTLVKANASCSGAGLKINATGQTGNNTLLFNQSIAADKTKKTVIEFVADEEPKQVTYKPYLQVGTTAYHLNSHITDSNTDSVTGGDKIVIVIDLSGETTKLYRNGELTKNSFKTYPASAFQIGFLSTGHATANRDVTISNLKVWETNAELSYEVSDVTSTSAAVKFNMPLVKDPVITVDDIAATVTKQDELTYKITFDEKDDSASCSMVVNAVCATNAEYTNTSSFTTPVKPFIEYLWYEDGETTTTNVITPTKTENTAYNRADGMLNVTQKATFAYVSKAPENIISIGGINVTGDKLVIEYAYSFVNGGTDRQQRIYIGNGDGSPYMKPYKRAKRNAQKTNVKVVLDFTNQTVKAYENGVEVTGSGDFYYENENSFNNIKKQDLTIYLGAAKQNNNVTPSQYTAYDYIAIYEPSSTLKYEVVNPSSTDIDGATVKFNQPVSIEGATADSDWNVPNAYKIPTSEKKLGEEWNLSFDAQSLIDSALTARLESSDVRALTADFSEKNISCADSVVTGSFKAVTNGTRLPINVMLAAYSDGKLAAVNMQTVTAKSGENNISVSADGISADGRTYKMYIWSAMEGSMIPYDGVTD